MASLQAESGENGLSLEGMVGSESPEEGMVEKVALHTAINRLPERERKLIFLRYYKGFTQDKTAKVLGISQVQGLPGWRKSPSCFSGGSSVTIRVPPRFHRPRSGLPAQPWTRRIPGPSPEGRRAVGRGISPAR